MASDTSEETIEQASAAGNLALVQDWIQRLSVYRGTALEESMLQRLELSLLEAARHGRPAVFSYLLDQGLPIDDYVMKSMQHGQSVEVFQALLDHGWDINSKIFLGVTSLSMNLRNADLVSWHLKHGADPNIITRRGLTALNFASCKFSLEVVKLLVQHGADVTNTTAIHSAISNSIKVPPVAPGRLDIVTYLLECGANINQLEPTADEYERPPTTSYTGTPLHRAVQSENPEHVSYLLSRGADRSIKGALGMTPLEVAERYHLDEIAAMLREK